jgi:microcystin-dependent protein
MSQPFIGEIRMFGGNFAPAGWAFCNGQVMSIAQNNALFALIGTTYGGDGVQTFNLPNLMGRLPTHQGGGFVIGQLAGTENVTLTLNQIPQHNHSVAAATSANSKSPSGAVYGGNTADHVYTANAPSAQMNAGMVGIGGGSQPHSNMMPYGVVSFIISLFGIFPSQN